MTDPRKSGQVHQATLPVEDRGGIFLDAQKARAFGEALSADYLSSDPYPHIVIDNFLPEAFANALLENFPAEKLRDDTNFENGYEGHHKRQIFPESCGGYARGAFNFFNSSPVLQFLEGLTKIEGLVGDAYFNGGGFHEIKRGGKLGIHADFRINKQFHLARRLNLLIYLNKDWQDSYGGFLEIWDKSVTKKVESIAPVFNRCVIFNTDADSYHGHPDPLNTPDGITRKSVALYYYTASQRIYDDTPGLSTMYVARPSDDIGIKKEAIKLRSINYLHDWLPPVLIRKITRVKDLIKRR